MSFNGRSGFISSKRNNKQRDRYQTMLDEQLAPAGNAPNSIRCEVLFDELPRKPLPPFPRNGRQIALRNRYVLNAYEAAQPSRTHKASRESKGANSTCSPKCGQPTGTSPSGLDQNHDIVIGILDKWKSG